jgi:hypothetical protein
MKMKWRVTVFLMSILCVGIQLHAQQTDGQYKIFSTASGESAETYMLDKQSGRVWMMRGQVSKAPFLIVCLYQFPNGKTALSPLDAGPPTVSTNNRFSIKSATSGQYADTYILDETSGHVWIMRGQVSQVPSLIPCIYQLSASNTALSPIDEASVSIQATTRFSITCVASGQQSETYVNDFQNGGVWMMRGQISKTPYLIPCAYQLLDGNTALIPMERQKEINSLQKNASQTGTLQDSQGAFDNQSQLAPQKLPPDVQKRLDDSFKKTDEEMNKLFPQGTTNNVVPP